MSRNTMGNSLVAYLCGISRVDPIKNNLTSYFTYGIKDRYKKLMLHICFAENMELSFIKEIKKIPNIKICVNDLSYNLTALSFTSDNYIANKFDMEKIDNNLKDKIKCGLLFIFKDATINRLNILSNLTNTNPTDISINDEKILLNINNFDFNLIGNNDFYNNFIEKYKINDYEDFVKMFCIGHGSGLWDYIKDIENIQLKNIISNRDDLFALLLQHGLNEYDAFVITETITGGKFNEDVKNELINVGVDDFTINLLSKVDFLVSKAHAYEIALNYWRIIWYKINYPNEFSKYVNNKNYV